MAEEWTRFNLKLLDHPKVVAIARSLNKTPLSWEKFWTSQWKGEFPLSVAIRVIVCGMMRIWCHVNVHGKPSGNDYVIRNFTLQDIDLVTDIQGLGAGMLAVGWAVLDEDTSIRFPNFLTYNIPAEERRRIKDRLRKANKDCGIGAENLRKKSGNTAELCSVVLCIKERGVGETTVDEFAPRLVSKMGMANGPAAQVSAIKSVLRKAARLKLTNDLKRKMVGELFALAGEIAASPGVQSPPAMWIKRARDLIAEYAA